MLKIILCAFFLFSFINIAVADDVKISIIDKIKTGENPEHRTQLGFVKTKDGYTIYELKDGKILRIFLQGHDGPEVLLEQKNKESRDVS